MCGLYSFRKSAEEVANHFRLPAKPVLAPREHVAPGGPIAILRPENGALTLGHVRWGLIPGWVKVIEASAKPLTNARSETILEKASFKAAMRHRRCLIPADGFYEWQGEAGRKQAFHIHRPDNGIFAFAGIWESWMGKDGSELESAAIITTQANRVVGIIHHRMPVVVEREDWAAWLDCAHVRDAEAAKLLRPAADDYFICEKVIVPRGGKPPAEKPKPAQLDLF